MHISWPEDIVIKPQRLMNRARMSHGREAPWGSGGLAPGWGVQGGRQPPRVGSRKEHDVPGRAYLMTGSYLMTGISNDGLVSNDGHI